MRKSLIERPFTNTRGAAFLLAVYLAALTLLLLGGVSLQRTNTEFRAAQVARDQQRGFWLAEAGLDKALLTVRTNPGSIQDTIVNSVAIGPGISTYQLTQRSLDLSQWKTSTRQKLYDIAAAGQVTTTSPQSKLGATLGSFGPLKGLAARKTVQVWYTGSDYPTPTKVTGDIAVAAGTPGAVYVSAGATVDGGVTIAPKDPQNPWINFITPDGQPGNDQTDGIVKMPADKEEAVIDHDFGMGLMIPGYNLKAAKITGTPSQMPITSIPSVVPPENCQLAPLELNDGDHYTPKKGDAFDISDPSDSRIVLCVPYVKIEDGATLTIKEPTTIYTTGVYEYVRKIRKTGRILSVRHYNFYNDGKVDTVAKLGSLPDRGLIVAAVGVGSDLKENRVVVGKFEGSIYAPDSDVDISETSAESSTDARGFYHANPTTRKLGFVVGGEVWVGADLDFSGDKRSSNTDTQPALLRWTN